MRVTKIICDGCGKDMHPNNPEDFFKANTRVIQLGFCEMGGLRNNSTGYNSQDVEMEFCRECGVSFTAKLRKLLKDFGRKLTTLDVDGGE